MITQHGLQSKQSGNGRHIPMISASWSLADHRAIARFAQGTCRNMRNEFPPYPPPRVEDPDSNRMQR